MNKLRIKWVKSDIGYPKDQKKTLMALGLRRLGQVIEKDNSAPVWGMANKVRHLVKIEVIGNETK